MDEKMSKFSIGFSSLGMILGIFVGCLMVYAALDHNPQDEFTNNPEGLIPIFYAWLAFVAFPFSFIAFVIEIIGYFKGKAGKLQTRPFLLKKKRK